MTNVLSCTFNRAASCFVLLVAVGIVFFPRELANGVSRPVVIVLAVVSGLAIWVLHSRIPDGAGVSRRHQVAWGLVFAMLSGVIAACIGRSLSYDFTWDAEAVMVRAEHLVEKGSLSDGLLAYLEAYPNNLGLLAVDRALIVLSKASSISVASLVAILNGVATGVSSFALFTITRSLSRFREAVFAQIAFLVLTGTLSWLAVPYTDIPTAALLATAAALVVVARGRKLWMELLLLAAAGMVLAGAAQLKPTSWVLVIAVLGYLLLTGNQRAALQKLTRVAAILVPFLVMMLSISSLLYLQVGASKETFAGKSFPPVHFVRMGMIEQESQGVTSYGGYNRAAVEEMYAATSRQERLLLSVDAIKENLNDHGILGYAGFLAKKAIWIWQDASFGSWREGADSYAPLLRDGPMSIEVQEWAHPDGQFYESKNEVLDGFWLALLLSGGVALWRSWRNPDLVILSLSTLGIGAFTLLFEGRSRYLVLFLPLLVATLITPLRDADRAAEASGRSVLGVSSER